MNSQTASKLMLFVDPRWKGLPGPYSLLMYPFWGNQLTDSSPFKKMAFETYPLDTNEYGITDELAGADAIFMPFSDDIALRYNPALLAECIALSRSSGLHLVVDGMGHQQTPFAVPNASIIRYGGYRFEAGENEIHITPFGDDLLERYKKGEHILREKQSKPRVGFVGWAKIPIDFRLKSILKELPDRVHGMFDSRYKAKRKGLFFREKALSVLAGSSQVEAQTVSRATYSGIRRTAQGDMEQLRKEFVDTMDASDYCLEVRGGTNTSTRFSEILSLGRIPVIIDTERNLPFADELPYAEFAVVVDFRHLSQLPSIVADFHTKLSPERFALMQQKAREVYLSHVRSDAVMAYIVRKIRQNIAKVKSGQPQS